MDRECNVRRITSAHRRPVRIALTRVAREGAVPFDLKPNTLTDETLTWSERGDHVHAASSAEDLFDKLGV